MTSNAATHHLKKQRTATPLRRKRDCGDEDHQQWLPISKTLQQYLYPRHINHLVDVIIEEIQAANEESRGDEASKWKRFYEEKETNLWWLIIITVSADAAVLNGYSRSVGNDVVSVRLSLAQKLRKVDLLSDEIENSHSFFSFQFASST